MNCLLQFEDYVKRAAFLALLLLTLSAQFSTSFAQGSLTPPGAPAPTMKSPAQIERRTIVEQTGNTYEKLPW